MYIIILLLMIKRFILLLEFKKMTDFNFITKNFS